MALRRCRNSSTGSCVGVSSTTNTTDYQQPPQRGAGSRYNPGLAIRSSLRLLLASPTRTTTLLLLATGVEINGISYSLTRFFLFFSSFFQRNFLSVELALQHFIQSLIFAMAKKIVHSTCLCLFLLERSWSQRVLVYSHCRPRAEE